MNGELITLANGKAEDSSCFSILERYNPASIIFSVKDVESGIESREAALRLFTADNLHYPNKERHPQQGNVFYSRHSVDEVEQCWDILLLEQ